MLAESLAICKRFNTMPRVGAIALCLSVPHSKALAAVASARPTVNWQRQLDERDAIIRDLQRRVEELERRAGASRPASTTAAPAEASEANHEAPDAATSTPSAAIPSAPPPRPPGQVTATEEEAERALERTLSATGALLVPSGQVDFEPSFTYTRRDNNVPALVNLNGDLVLSQQRVKRDEFVSSLNARFGLPFDSQLELGLPYNAVDQERVTNFGAGRASRSDSGAAFGDMSLGLAKTLLREDRWWPDIIARFTWDSDTGESRDNNVPLNGGFNDIIGQVVALKRQDPLAFVASAAYQKTFENNNIEPGNELRVSLGAYLATSPDTSISLVLNQQFVDDTRQNGRTIKDSDQNVTSLNFGISSILGRQVLLSLTAGVGLTEDAPDYSIGISLPVRFDLPVL